MVRKLSRQRQSRRTKLSVETLEQRCLLDVGLADGIWTIHGSPLADTIVVDRDPAHAGLLRVTINGQVADTEADSSVQGIRIEGGAGNDTLRIDESNGVIAIPTTMLGGSGNDTLVGGSGRDWLYGGSGDDSLSGGKKVA